MTHIAGLAPRQRFLNTVSPLLRGAAKGESCTLRIGGVCCHDPAQTVGAHLRLYGAAGVGEKPDDVFMLFACTPCHDALDRRLLGEEITPEDILVAFFETLRLLRRLGLLLIPGDPEVPLELFVPHRERGPIR